MTQIRAAVAADGDAVAAVGRAAFVRQYEGLVDPANYTWAARQWYSKQAIRQSIEQCAADPAARFLVAERDGEIVGFLQYDEAGPEPELHRIYVAPATQGSGIGGGLMNALHQRLPASASYVLLVVEGNDAAVRFYQRHGLREERRAGAHAYYRQTRRGEACVESLAAVGRRWLIAGSRASVAPELGGSMACTRTTSWAASCRGQRVPRPSSCVWPWAGPADSTRCDCGIACRRGIALLFGRVRSVRTRGGPVAPTVLRSTETDVVIYLPRLPGSPTATMSVRHAPPSRRELRRPAHWRFPPQQRVRRDLPDSLVSKQ